jgi:hypothetical protein
MGNEPHVPRRGWLKNGNPPGDVSEGAPVWGKNTPADTVPRTRHEERPLPVARRAEHGAENGRRTRAEPTRAVEARGAFP